MGNHSKSGRFNGESAYAFYHDIAKPYNLEKVGGREWDLPNDVVLI